MAHNKKHIFIRVYYTDETGERRTGFVTVPGDRLAEFMDRLLLVGMGIYDGEETQFIKPERINRFSVDMSDGD